MQDKHFRTGWSAPYDVGRRAVVQATADIAAMGGVGEAVVVSLGCPPSTPAQTVLALDSGIVAAAHELGARVVGGDLVATAEIVVTVTVLGSTQGRAPVAITGARPGDVLALSGPVGMSAAGLAVLDAGSSGVDSVVAAEVVAAHRVPIADLRQGVAAAHAAAHAMTDVSDGLVDDAEAIATASAVGVDLDTRALPRPAALVAAANALGVDWREWALAGGEDHQLLAAFGGDPPAGWTVIGDVTGPRDAGDAVLVDGVSSRARGWTSFGPGPGG